MNLKIISQGLNCESDISVGDYIISSLTSNDYNSFKAFVAFISVNGIENIIEEINTFKERGGKISLYLGVDLYGTSREALEKLLDQDIETYIIYTPNNIIYHPKIYIFEGDEKIRILVGSSNLTVRGLFQNIETSVCIDFEKGEDHLYKLNTDIYEYFESIMNSTHESCQKLTHETLELLTLNKIVINEVISREKNNKINQEFSKKSLSEYKNLIEKFKKIKTRKPPKGFKKVLKKEEYFVETDKKVSVVYKTITVLELAPDSMWIETGEMTGGSRNILDLSKSGKRDGVKKFGSLGFFGLNPDEEDTEKNINIHLGDKIYIDNLIFFAPRNSNWRLRLNGKTDNGEKLTTFSKIENGGGFVQKIFLFTRLDDINFKLEILDSDELEILINNSSDWARGGSGQGRAYGIIAPIPHPL